MTQMTIETLVTRFTNQAVFPRNHDLKAQSLGATYALTGTISQDDVVHYYMDDTGLEVARAIQNSFWDMRDHPKHEWKAHVLAQLAHRQLT